MMLFEDFFWDSVGRKRRATAGESSVLLMMLFEDFFWDSVGRKRRATAGESCIINDAI